MQSRGLRCGRPVQYRSNMVGWWTIVCVGVQGMVSTGAATEAEVPTDKEKLVVMALRGERGLDDSSVRLVGDLMLTEFNEQAGSVFDVLGVSDMDTLLEAAGQRELLQSCKDADCYTELAEALNARFIAGGSVGQLGDSFLLNLVLYDNDEVKVVHRLSESLPADENELLDGVRRATNELLVASGYIEPEKHFPWAPVTLTVLGAAAAGTSIGLGVDAVNGSNDGKDTRDQALAADILLWSGVGLAATGILWLILSVV